MELDIKTKTGRRPWERNADRPTRRNGYRNRSRETRVGTIELRIPKPRIPKLRRGSSFATCLAPRRVSGQTLGALGRRAETFRPEFPRKLRRRGLTGVKLMVSDSSSTARSKK